MGLSGITQSIGGAAGWQVFACAKLTARYAGAWSYQEQTSGGSPREAPPFSGTAQRSLDGQSPRAFAATWVQNSARADTTSPANNAPACVVRSASDAESGQPFVRPSAL